MKTKQILISILLGGSTMLANAQVAASLSPQYTRTYTDAEVTTLAKPINTTNIKENVYCSFVDTESNSATNIKRSFVLNNSGAVMQKVNTYAKSASASSVGANANINLSYHASGTTSPILSSSLNGFSNLSVSTSGNRRTFSYTVAGKTKNVVATSSGFFYRYGGSALYMKGC